MFRLIKGLFVINQFELILFKGCPILIFGPPFYLISIFKKRGVYDVVFGCIIPLSVITIPRIYLSKMLKKKAMYFSYLVEVLL